MAEEIKGIDYTPKEVTKPLSNSIPWYGAQPVDSWISIRGKVYTKWWSINSWVTTVTVKWIPFKPSIVDIKAVSNDWGSWSACTQQCWEQYWSGIRLKTWLHYTTAFIIDLYDSSWNSVVWLITKATNDWFIIEFTSNETQFDISYIAYA